MFVGGAQEEYAKYLGLPHVTPLWRFVLATEVKGYAGISVVLKRDGVMLRKVLMPCASNYWWTSPSERHDHGMLGGEAFSRMNPLAHYPAGTMMAMIVVGGVSAGVCAGFLQTTPCACKAQSNAP